MCSNFTDDYDGWGNIEVDVAVVGILCFEGFERSIVPGWESHKSYG